MSAFKKTLLISSMAVAISGCSTLNSVGNWFSSSENERSPAYSETKGAYTHGSHKSAGFQLFEKTEAEPQPVVKKVAEEPEEVKEKVETSVVTTPGLNDLHEHYGLEVIANNDYFVPKPLYGFHKVKNFKLPRMRIIDNNLFNVMERLLQQTDYDLVMSESLAQRMATKAFTLKGNLTDILQQLSRVFEVHIIEDKGTVYVLDETEFFVRTPDISRQMSNKLVADIEEIGAIDVKMGENRSIQYIATQEVNERVNKYLYELRVNKPLISYNVYFWEVELERGQEIKWEMYDRLAMKLDSSLPVGIDDDGSSVVEGVYNLQCSNNALDPTFMQSFLKTQGKVRFTKRPELSSVSGEPVEMSFSEGTNKGFGRVDKTTVTLKGVYDADQVKTTIRIESGTVSGVENEDKDITKVVLNESARAYPGGTSLITDINGHAKRKEQNVQYVMLLEPKVDLFEHPGVEFLQRAAGKAHRACTLEKENRKKTITYRALIENEIKKREYEAQQTQQTFDKGLSSERDQKEYKMQEMNAN